MAYRELIKNFKRIRNYMRQFYVYGFRSRSEYNLQSLRSYDNEKRRIESWLGNYMMFRHDENGKQMFLSVDGRRIPFNPLFQAFKAKSFTDGDITFHFIVMDILSDGREHTLKDIQDRIALDYQTDTGESSLEESTIRKKLKEYEELGLVEATKKGREKTYCIKTDHFDLTEWEDALSFYSETDPVGVIGSYLLDQCKTKPDIFRFKHHYILGALDQEIAYDLLTAISERKAVLLTIAPRRKQRKQGTSLVCPVKILSGTHSGRQYLLGYSLEYQDCMIYRLDSILDVKPQEEVSNWGEIKTIVEQFEKHLWGVSRGNSPKTEWLEMTIKIREDEPYILERLKREARNGSVEKVDDTHYRYHVVCYDCMELVPWVRTFIGRVDDLKCSNAGVIETFQEDLAEMQQIYGETE